MVVYRKTYTVSRENFAVTAQGFSSKTRTIFSQTLEDKAMLLSTEAPRGKPGDSAKGLLK